MKQSATIRSVIVPFAICVSAFAVTAAPALAGQEDCEIRMQKLEKSDAEGQARLDEKNAVIGFCANQYKRDKTIRTLVDTCAKFEEQPVVKQQFVAECQLAAFNYANALHTLKAEFGK